MSERLYRREFLKAAGAGAGALALSRGAVAGIDGDEARLPTPTPPQLVWQDAELGLVYHYDLHLFHEGPYSQQENRKTDYGDPDKFCPRLLDTKQWIQAAKACGAKFAIITASHETGFRLWQSDANPYCLKATTWGHGKRDIVEEFIAACDTVGIKPGVYMGTRWNGRLGVWDFKVTERSPLTQEQYNRLIQNEVEEICGRYGKLFEIWFDGGAHCPEHGGPDILPIFERLQPDCLFYHNWQRADARWGGTESGTVPYPCWATMPWQGGHAQFEGTAAGSYEVLKHGDPNGKYWRPAMSDSPLRNHHWFWQPDTEHTLFSLEALQDMYYKSVGRNSTLIIGAAPDARGLMPEGDIERLKEWGDWIRNQFAHPIAWTSGEGPSVELTLPHSRAIGHAIIQEDIRDGERVREYVLEGFVAGEWKRLSEGSCIGHKRIERFAPAEVSKVRVRVTKAVGKPRIRNLAVAG